VRPLLFLAPVELDRVAAFGECFVDSLDRIGAMAPKVSICMLQVLLGVLKSFHGPIDLGMTLAALPHVLSTLSLSLTYEYGACAKNHASAYDDSDNILPRHSDLLCFLGEGLKIRAKDEKLR
jgi:hypothetical protein